MREEGICPRMIFPSIEKVVLKMKGKAYTTHHLTRRFRAACQMISMIFLACCLILSLPVGRMISGPAGRIISSPVGRMFSGPAGIIAHAEEIQTVRVGYYENEIFQEGAREGDVKTGYAYEYYRKLAEYTGWKYDYVYGTFADLYQMLLDGEIDLLAGLAYREERNGLIGYPEAAMGHESYNLIKHEDDTEISADPMTLKGKRIGVLDSAIDDALRRFLDSHHVDAEVVTFRDYEDLFASFSARELDVFAGEGDTGLSVENAVIMGSFGASDYFLAVNVHRPDLLEQLNTAQTLLSAEEPNYLNSLSTKYYSGSISSRAFTEAETEWLASHDQLRVGYLDTYLPYSDTDENGQVTGIVTDVTEQMLKSLHIDSLTISYRGYENYDEMIADLVSGEIDTGFPVGGGLYYSEESGIYQTSPVVSAATELVFRGEFNADKVSHFAVNENNRMQYYYVRTRFPDAQITLYPSVNDALDAVAAGKEDATTLNGLRANDLLKNTRYESLSLLQLSQSDDRCYGVAIGNEGLLKLLNRGLGVLGVDYGQNQAYRYADGLYSYSFFDLVRQHLGIFILAIMAIAAVLIALLWRDNRRTHLQNKAKTDFLNNMSHDIRTPMNAIVGFTALASSHMDQPDLVKDYLQKITVSSQHLLALINDVLDMSRIESGKVVIEEGEVHLPDVIRGLKTIVQADAAAKQLDLQMDTADIKHEDIITDKLRLNQVLLNILSNAIKFTPAGGTIRFQLTEEPSSRADTASFVFRIKDNGIGMSREFQTTIFEAFTRERTSTVSGTQGTGLGMAITKNILDMMGGSITVQSEEGKGSEFTVRLSCKISDGKGKDRAGDNNITGSKDRAEEDSGSGRNDSVDVENGSGSKDRAEEENGSGRNDRMDGKTSAAEKETSTVDFTGKRILLVEDNELNQMIAVAILEEVGLTIEIAPNGAEAVEKMEQAPAGTYDVIFMDIQMPIMNGYEAAKRIRALEDPKKARIPIVAVTANAFEEDRKVAMEAGMNGHLAKPYDVDAIMKTLSRFLG